MPLSGMAGFFLLLSCRAFRKLFNILEDLQPVDISISNKNIYSTPFEERLVYDFTSKNGTVMFKGINNMSSFSICEAGCAGHGACDFLLVKSELSEQWKSCQSLNHWRKDLDRLFSWLFEWSNWEISVSYDFRKFGLLALHAPFLNWLFFAGKGWYFASSECEQYNLLST